MAIPKLKDLLKEFTTTATGTGAKKHWNWVDPRTSAQKATTKTAATTKDTKAKAYKTSKADYDTKSDDYSSKDTIHKTKKADYSTKKSSYDTAKSTYDTHLAAEPTRYQTITTTDTSKWIHPYVAGDKGTTLGKGQTQPRYGWSYTQAAPNPKKKGTYLPISKQNPGKTAYGQGSELDYKQAVKGAAAAGQTGYTPVRATTNPTTSRQTTRPQWTTWNTALSDYSARKADALSQKQAADTAKAQALADKEAAAAARDAAETERAAKEAEKQAAEKDWQKAWDAWQEYIKQDKAATYGQKPPAVGGSTGTRSGKGGKRGKKGGKDKD